MVSLLLFASAFRFAAELEKESTVRIELDPTGSLRRTRVLSEPVFGPRPRFLELMITAKFVCREKAMIRELEFSLMRKRRGLSDVPVPLEQIRVELRDGERVIRLDNGLLLDGLSITVFNLRAVGFFLDVHYEIDERHFLRIRAFSHGHEPSVLDLFWDWDDQKRRNEESRMIFTASELRRASENRN